MRTTNAVAKANATVGKINTYYDMSWENVLNIKEEYGGNIDSICCAFRFGYLQGMKAAKAEMKMKGVTV